MIRVFRIVAGGPQYAKVVLRDPIGFESRYPQAFSGREMGEPQREIRCTLNDYAKPMPDIAAFLPGTFVVKKAIADASSHYDAAGELLPISLDGVEAYALNVLHILNALRSPCEATSERFRFWMNRIGGPSIFKIPQTAQSDILTYTGVLAEEDEFISECHALGLTGVRFEELDAGEMQ